MFMLRFRKVLGTIILAGETAVHVLVISRMALNAEHCGRVNLPRFASHKAFLRIGNERLNGR